MFIGDVHWFLQVDFLSYNLDNRFIKAFLNVYDVG